jgi:hypothetical protein
MNRWDADPYDAAHEPPHSYRSMRLDQDRIRSYDDHTLVTLTGARAVPDPAWIESVTRYLARRIDALFGLGDRAEHRIIALERRVSQIEEAMGEMEAGNGR